MIETANIWFSAHVSRWNVCVLERRSDGAFERHRADFDNFESCLRWLEAKNFSAIPPKNTAGKNFDFRINNTMASSSGYWSEG